MVGGLNQTKRELKAWLRARVLDGKAQNELFQKKLAFFKTRLKYFDSTTIVVKCESFRPSTMTAR